jgi:hypothetical protein
MAFSIMEKCKPKEIIFSILFLIFCVNLMAQTTKVRKEGVVVFNRPFFKNCAILMQDTALSGNRFNNWFDIANDDNRTINPKITVLYPAFIIDSNLFLDCEARLLKSDSTILYYNYSKDRLQDIVTKYIRLYIGYIDLGNRKNVVIQFLTRNEFEKLKYIYSNELFLMARKKNLRFAIIKL